jgi:TonB-dependent receptor
MLVCCVAFISASVFGQMGGVRGTVTDKDFEALLPEVKVRVSETEAEVTTDESGSYYVENLQPGSYTLIFLKGGYSRFIRSVVVTPGQLTDLDVELEGEYEEMDELVVRDIQLGGSSEIGLLNLRMESMAMLDSVGADMMSQAGASDAASALRLVAGATVQDGKYAVVRGLPDRYISTQMNGVRLPTADPDKRAVQLDQFPAALIDSIQVSKTFTPDQQGDASGAAVNVVLKAIPDEPVLSVKLGVGHNSQATGNSNFRTYSGGGVNYWGLDDGGRDLPFGVENAYTDVETAKFAWNPPPNAVDLERYAQREWQVNQFSPVMGSKTKTAPMNHNWSVTAGNSWNMDTLKLGALGTLFYSNEFEHFEDGVNEKRKGDPNAKTYIIDGTDSSDNYELFDVTKSKESVLWGGLLVLGAETENHELGLTYMQTHAAEDSVQRMDEEETEAFLGGDTERYYRLETLRYTERDASTLQLRGKHTLPFPEVRAGSFFSLLNPEVDWTLSKNDSILWEPDMRSMRGSWDPVTEIWRPETDPGSFAGLRLWRDIEEKSDQWQVNGKIPFEQWTETEGFLKAGLFTDSVERTYEQDSFHYKHGPGNTPWGAATSEYTGSFDGSSYTDIFGFDEATGYDGIDYDSHTTFRLQNEMPWQILNSGQSADYDGTQEINAWYWMADVPVASWLKVTGGVRTEKTKMETEFRASDGNSLQYFRWEQGEMKSEPVGPDRWHEANAGFDRTDVLPALGLELEPIDGLKFRGAYSETVARPTFKEIAPILQIDYLGSDQFVGNNGLGMSELKNYDLRVEYVPVAGTFLSASWFYKEIIDPIEYVTIVIAQDPYVQPFNFPEGWMEGYELEARQELGQWHEWLEGLQFRMNATFIESEVTVPEVLPGTTKTFAGSPFGNPVAYTIQSTRDMRGTPEYLLNLNLSYDISLTDTQLNLFYIRKGDTLITGEGDADGHSPNVYEAEVGELNVGISQKIGDRWKLSFMAKNILDPAIETVYRADYAQKDAVKTSYTKGVSYSLSLSGEF